MGEMRDGRGVGGPAYDALVDDIDHELNPSNEECWNCGGEGYVADCFDGCCVDAESGCEDCARPCPECAVNKHDRLKAIREAVVKANNIDIAIAWLMSIGRWRPGITREQVQSELDKANASLTAPSEPAPHPPATA